MVFSEFLEALARIAEAMRMPKLGCEIMCT